MCGVWRVQLGTRETTHHIPESQLPLTHSTEAGGEDVAVGEENGPHGSSALVCLLLLL